MSRREEDGHLDRPRPVMSQELRCPRCRTVIGAFPAHLQLSEPPADAQDVLDFVHEYVAGIQDLVNDLLRAHFDHEHKPVPFWVSFWHDHRANGPFVLHWPWWICGRDDRGRTAIVAAVREEDASRAQDIIHNAYRQDPRLEWRFVDPQPEDFSPFSTDFPRQEWMRWDEPDIWSDLI